MNRLETMKAAARSQAGYLFLLAVMIAGSAALFLSGRAVDAKVAAAKEEARPADVELTVLTTPDCADCFDPASITAAIDKGPLHVLKREAVAYDSEEGKALVAAYDVNTVPTVILKGEIEKTNAHAYLEASTQRRDDALIWTGIPPVFLDAKTGQAFGRVTVTMIGDRTCPDCFDPELVEGILRDYYGVHVTESRTVDRYSAEGSGLVATYGITDLPSLVISPDIVAYQGLVKVWPTVGSIENDGAFVFRGAKAMGYVYRDLTTGEIIRPVTAQ